MDRFDELPIILHVATIFTATGAVPSQDIRVALKIVQTID